VAKPPPHGRGAAVGKKRAISASAKKQEWGVPRARSQKRPREMIKKPTTVYDPETSLGQQEDAPFPTPTVLGAIEDSCGKVRVGRIQKGNGRTSARGVRFQPEAKNHPLQRAVKRVCRTDRHPTRRFHSGWET